VFVTDKHFQPSLIFVGKSWSLPLLVGSCDGSTQALALSANIGLGWKLVTVTNTLAYHGTELNTPVKSFICHALWMWFKNPFLLRQWCCDEVSWSVWCWKLFFNQVLYFQVSRTLPRWSNLLYITQRLACSQ
jgi:hypothetical protein